jgi:hypothetical protein
LDLEIVIEAENAGHKVAGLADDPWHGLAQKKLSFEPSTPQPLHLHRIDIGVSHWSRSTRAKGDFRSSLGLYHKRQVVRGGREKCLLKGGAETDSSPSIDPQLAIHRTRS